MKLVIAISCFFLSYSCIAEESVYDALADIAAVTDGYVVKKTDYGIDLNSVEQYENSKGVTEPVTSIVLEGPFSQIKTLDQGVAVTANVIKSEVDADYEAEHPVYDGLDAVKTDVNGASVALLSYKLNREPDTYITRALIVSEKGLYSYAITMHKSHPKDQRGLRLIAIVIASVDSGKL